MKQVKIICGNGGRVRILAHGTFGLGTAEFTLRLGKALGEIIERHQGTQHVHNETETKGMVETHG